MKYLETFKKTPNAFKNLNNTCLGLILHHSAESYQHTIASCLNDRATKRVSYHVVIDTNGERTVFAEDHTITWHAGVSSFHGVQTANICTIGLSWTGDTAKRLPSEAEMQSALEYVLPRYEKHRWTTDKIKTHGEVALPKGRKVDCSLEWKKIFIDLLLQNISPR